MATERIEETIVRNLLCNEEYYRKVIPHLDTSYFENNVDKTIFEEIQNFSCKYDKLPTKEVLRISLGQRNDVTDETYKCSIDQIASYTDEWVDFNWLVDATEKWCQERAIYNALMQSIKIADGGDKKVKKDAIPSILQDALSVSFDEHIGHDYIESADERYEFYHRDEEKYRLISRSLTILQKVVSLIRLSMSHLLVLVSGKVYSCAIWLAPPSCKGVTFSMLHLRWQKKKLLNELMQTVSISTSKT